MALAVLAADIDYVYFPRTVGEPFGMEWWHFQLAEGLRMSKRELTDLKARAKEEKASVDSTIESTQAELKAAASKKAANQARANLIKLRKQQRSLSRLEAVEKTNRSWWSMIQEIGWVEEAMRAMGYKDEDFTEIAH